MVILPIQLGTRLFFSSLPFIYTLQATLEDPFSGRSLFLGAAEVGLLPKGDPIPPGASPQYLSGVDTAGPATVPHSIEERARSQVNPGNPNSNSGGQAGDKNPTADH